MVLTVNGKAVVVVQDADSYQNLLDRVALLESMAGIRKSVAECKQGQGMSLDEAFTQLRAKHDLPD